MLLNDLCQQTSHRGEKCRVNMITIWTHILKFSLNATVLIFRQTPVLTTFMCIKPLRAHNIQPLQFSLLYVTLNKLWKQNYPNCIVLPLVKNKIKEWVCSRFLQMSKCWLIKNSGETRVLFSLKHSDWCCELNSAEVAYKHKVLLSRFSAELWI